MKRLLALSLAILPLAGCSLFESAEPPVEEETQASSVPETKNVIYRGTITPLGASIYMQGTHRLELEDGRFVLLESDGVILDDYMNEQVEVFGSTRPTVEGGGIIMRVERVAAITESSETMVEASSSSSSSSETVSSAPPAVSSVPPASSSRASLSFTIPSSSSAAPVASSAASSVESSSVSSESTAVMLRVQTMAKANMDASNWTQQYCTTHIGFCIPVHKNWYYTSFGTTSSSLWHVELSSEELESLGDGPLTVVLESGLPPGPDGQVIVENGTVKGIRAWTNNRHFVISAPAVLEKAVRHVTQELVAAPGAAE